MEGERTIVTMEKLAGGKHTLGEPLLTSEEVIEYLGVSSQTLSNLVKDGELRAVRVGRLFRFRREDVEEYLGKSYSTPVRPKTIAASAVLTPRKIAGKAGVPIVSATIAETALPSVQRLVVRWGDDTSGSAEFADGKILASHTYENPGSYSVIIEMEANGLVVRATAVAEIAAP